MSTSKLTGAIERHGMNRAIDSTPTAVMLEELKAAGIELPTDEEITKLSEKICLWLAEYRRQVLCAESKPSWYNLYALLDQDGSGFITCAYVQRELVRTRPLAYCTQLLLLANARRAVVAVSFLASSQV